MTPGLVSSMGKIDFNVDAVSMNDVVRQLDAVGNLPSHAGKALAAGAEIVLRSAKEIAPVRSGELKAALRVGRRKKTRDRYAVEVGTFYPDAAHAHLVEHGHGGPKPAPAHPFLEPAVDSTEDEVIDAVMEELMKGL